MAVTLTRTPGSVYGETNPDPAKIQLLLEELLAASETGLRTDGHSVSIIQPQVGTLPDFSTTTNVFNNLCRFHFVFRPGAIRGPG